MNKELIKKRFAKNLNSYNENAKIQKIMAEKLLSYLPDTRFDNILEIGCGTGFLTELAAKKLEFKTYTANDIVPECEGFIKNIDQKIGFTCSDIEAGLKNSTKTYDLIISNATFQWIENLEGFVSLLVSKLTRGGILLFSTFGKENFKEIACASGKTLDYYSIPELDSMLEGLEHSIEEEVLVLKFSAPKAVLKHMSLTGVNAIEAESWTKSDLRRFEEAYDSECSLTYNPIYVLIKNQPGGYYQRSAI